MSLRGGLLLGILLVLVAVKVVSHIQVRLLEDGLQDIADQRLEWLRRNEWVNMSGETETAVVVSKPFIVFGQATGKIEVYFRQESLLGEPRYAEYDFHLVQRDGSWVETDSGLCHHTECEIRAAAVFGD
jgi:hypothetical protein